MRVAAPADIACSRESRFAITFVRHAQELGFSLTEVKELLALRQKHHGCSEVQSILKRKVGDVPQKINSLSRLEAELADALRKCNRELRLRREIKHEDCCPPLTKLDRKRLRRPQVMSQVEENLSTNKSGSRSSVIASLAALGSAIAASSCCLPLLPFVFAAGAAGTAAFVAQLRPYLLVLSVLLIAFSFYKSWRAKQCNCKPSRISTLLLWVSAFMVFIFICFPQVIANLVADLLAGKS